MMDDLVSKLREHDAAMTAGPWGVCESEPYMQDQSGYTVEAPDGDAEPWAVCAVDRSLPDDRTGKKHAEGIVYLRNNAAAIADRIETLERMVEAADVLAEAVEWERKVRQTPPFSSDAIEDRARGVARVDARLAAYRTLQAEASTS